LYKNSKKEFGASFVLFYKEGTKKEVGFTASKKIGNAVKRNFAKRRLRSLFLEFSPKLKNGSYIFVARQKIINLKYSDIKKGLFKSFKKVNALKSEEK